MNRSTQFNQKEIWAKHYSSNHRILLVGEGDFSFALSLADSFQSGFKIVASSIDSYDDVIQKYKSAETNLNRLGNLGARLLFGVDACTMEFHRDLYLRKFDRIVFNFPHAGFLGKESDDGVILSHRYLVFSFFKNASQMLRPNGEVHVSHKTKFPFDCWNIVELASQSRLTLLECVEFKLEDYPGYINKRGDGLRSDEPFPLGECCTFKFISSSTATMLNFWKSFGV
ncbi:heavy metal-associated isoprenylated plant protein 41-like [Cynara cardunculus var. scolymus]|uniref:heavy metal-associated isoprenylated plant protein 41-like n=1 Tax=Cynara cardunculus var. scolymus TaxID=59895 RepID=UPI000D627A80|nr:heavy metal-associated isoprenylated plant protein 41-like [Cynara cardunculus var. scolymus]